MTAARDILGWPHTINLQQDGLIVRVYVLLSLPDVHDDHHRHLKYDLGL
jgi:hypothetical protein